MTNTEQQLIQWLQQQLQAEQILWQAFPDPTKRAKQPLMSSLTSSWISLRILLLLGTLIILFVTSVIYHSNMVIPLIYGGILLGGFLIVVSFIVVRRQKTLRQLQQTLYTITTKRLIVITLDGNQMVQNSYYPLDLARIDLIERSDGWGDIVLEGQQRVQSRGFSLTVISPRLSGVERVREVALLLTRLKSEQSVLPQR